LLDKVELLERLEYLRKQLNEIYERSTLEEALELSKTLDELIVEYQRGMSVRTHRTFSPD
jgi:hypothetical protein